ncbi:MAG: DNA alkylation repair protein, partial [Clostridiales bacterium]|nr:DNA alkylation repair protein [Clostridiales bacterium]
MTERAIRETLRSMADPGYAAFSKKLKLTAYEILGVRLPALKALSKSFSREEARVLLDTYTDFLSHEEFLLYGLVLSRQKDPLYVMDKLDALVPRLENWAHVDCILAALKLVAKNRALFLARYRRLAAAPGEFEKRFLAVLLLDYYVTDEYAGEVLALYASMPQGQYYTDMAIAWGLSVLLIKRYELTLPYLA